MEFLFDMEIFFLRRKGVYILVAIPLKNDLCVSRIFWWGRKGLEKAANIGRENVGGRYFLFKGTKDIAVADLM
jgi:hypothetical protein